MTATDSMARPRGWAALGLSALVHVVLAALLYYIGPYKAAERRVQRDYTATTKLSGQVRSAQRVKDLEAIKALLEQSSSAALAKRDAPPKTIEPDFSATSLPPPPEKLLEHARELSKAIEQIDVDNQAEERARALKVSKEEAREQIASEPAASA